MDWVGENCFKIVLLTQRENQNERNEKASIIGASASADVGNGFSVVANYSRRSDDTVREAVDTIASVATAGASGNDRQKKNNRAYWHRDRVHDRVTSPSV